MRVLAIEASTSSAKALLYDTEKGVEASASRRYGADLERDGMTDTEGVFRLAMEVAREVAYGREVAAIALCGTWHGLSVLDHRMKPVTPTFSWNFTKTAKGCAVMRENQKLTDRMYRETGCMVHDTYLRHLFPWLKEQGMKLEDKRFITQGGYLFYRLTGVFLESACTHSGTGLIHLADGTYDEFVLDLFGIKKEQLGSLGTYRDIRLLTKEGAEILGLQSGIPVVPAHADGALNQIGNYADREGVMTMSVGTSGAIRMRAEHPVLPKGRELWCYLGAEGFLSGAAVAGACNCIQWYTEHFLKNTSSYESLERNRVWDQTVPVFLPFLYGERCPGWQDKRRGEFVNVEASHDQAAFYASIQMGILFNLYQCYRILVKENQEPELIILSGGIKNSAVWTQMAADIFEKDLLLADCPNASCMGAVALALHAAGELKEIREFRADFDRAVPVKCRPERFDFYQTQYERYLTAYCN